MKSITQVVQNLLKPYIDRKDRATQANIAPVETDATSASQAYAEGAQLILNDVLYDVTAAITQGDALVVNTNIAAADDITTQIKNHTVTTDPVPTQNSTNPVQSGGVFTAEANEAATRSAMGAKNRLPISLASLKAINTAGSWNGNAYTVDNVTYTVNTDSEGNITSITTSGTASTNSALNILGTDTNYDVNNFVGMVLNGCPSGGGTAGTDFRIVAFVDDNQDGSTHTTINDTGSGVEIPNKNYIRIYLRVPNGYSDSLTFKPMIRLATDTDADYQPYAKTNKELTTDVSSLNTAFTNNVNQNGCKNIDKCVVGLPLTIRGVTFSYNSDKSIHVNGTNTGTMVSSLFLGSEEGNSVNLLVDEYFKNKNLIYVLHISNTDVNVRQFIQFYDSSMAQIGSNILTYTHTEFTVPNNAVYFRTHIRVGENETINNKDVYPMICLKSDYELDNSWGAWSKTNRQLTEDSVTWDNLSEVGAVNYLYPYDTTRVSTSGITFTLNSDNSVSMVSSSAPTSSDGFSYRNNNAAFLRGKTVRFKAKITGNTPTYDKLYFAVICRETESGANLYRADVWPSVGQTEVVFTVPSNTNYILVGCNIQSGATSAIDCTVSPMITPVSYNGPYVPYAMTNRELTEIVTVEDLYSQITNMNAKLTITSQQLSLLKFGNVVCLNMYISDVTGVTEWTEALFTLPSNCKPQRDVYIVDANNSGKVILIRAASGDVNVGANAGTIHAGVYIATYIVK